jgi:hypothetical protein
MGWGAHRINLSALVGEIEWGVRACGPRAAEPRTPTPAPPHKGEGLVWRFPEPSR